MHQTHWERLRLFLPPAGQDAEPEINSSHYNSNVMDDRIQITDSESESNESRIQITDSRLEAAESEIQIESQNLIRKFKLRINILNVIQNVGSHFLFSKAFQA